MKPLTLLLFCITAASLTLKLSTSSTASTSTITITLPRLYIKNQSSSDTTLQSLQVSYGYHTSNKIYYTQATGSISLPAGKLTSVNTSMQVSSTSSTPQIEGLHTINIEGKTLTVSSKLLGFGPDKPIVIDKKNNQWSIIA